ncbi:MAG: exopolysaccharide biosynthesis polyprenyl glycosylphosphotransferase [Terracidiphilus sp.]
MSASESATPRLYAEAIAAPKRRMRKASTRLFRSVLVCVELAVDFLTCSTGMLASYALYVSLHVDSQAQSPMRQAAAASVLVGMCAVLFLQWNGAYRGGGSLLQIRETERAIRVPVQSVLVLLAFSLILGIDVSIAAVLIALVLIPVLLILQKVIFFSIVRTLHTMGYGMDRAVVYGAGSAGKRVVSALFHSVRMGFFPVMVIDDNSALDGNCILEMGYRGRRSVPIQRGPVTPEILKSSKCSVLIVALPNLSVERQAAAADAANQVGMRVDFLSGLEFDGHQWTQSIDIDGFSLVPKQEPLMSWPYAISKRAVDLLVSSLLLVLVAPVLLLIAILIKLDSKGPALFIQKRVGKNGELFNIYKFRSMYANAPRYDFSPSSSYDPRITRIGRFIRQTSLDELPQLMNVFLGNMSLVGPRPEMPFIVQDYTSEHRQRLQASPGVTGLWQISADRSFQIHDNIQYDLYYLRNRGFFLDIAILIHTLFFAIRRGI